MCAICGVIQSQPVDMGVLNRMCDTMVHRGPDDRGSWLSADRSVGLAHRRLAIIDLSPMGHQPMTSTDGQTTIVFNGEIYNFEELRDQLHGFGHSFRGSSDTEVLLAAYREWGLECLARLNGMFAFAIYDVAERRLFIARDRAGEKPLYYRLERNRFSFASELKALLADPTCSRTVDLEAVEHYFAYGYVPGSRCIISGIQKLPQGHAAVVDQERMAIRAWRYWETPSPQPHASVDSEELLEELSSLLTDAVRRRLVADVPVGVLLSGGLDSSLVTAVAAASASRRIKTFTITFPDHVGIDEGPHARMVANHFGTEHVELRADEPRFDVLPLLARQFDEPLGDQSILPTYLVSRLVREHATVALGGDGGDELFGGYPHYSFLQTLGRLRPFVPSRARRALGSAAARLPVGSRGRNHLIGFSGGVEHSIAHVNLFFDRRSRDRLLSPLGERREELEEPEKYKERFCNAGASLLSMATAVDFRTTMVDDYLVKVDRASMLVSLEVRAPFLDHRLVEFAFGRVPDGLRATARERKILLKMLARRVLPRNLDLSRKQGFTLPLGSWFRSRWGALAEEVLHDAGPGIFDPTFVALLIRRQRSGFDNANRLFQLLMFELWRREYRVTV